MKTVFSLHERASDMRKKTKAVAFGVVRPFQMAIVAIACAWSSASVADVVRNIFLVSADVAKVEVAWSFPAVPESALIVTEEAAEGWALGFEASSNPAVSSVRRAGAKWSFLVDRAKLSTPGSFSYELSRMGGETGGDIGSLVCGTFSVSSISGVAVAAVARGLDGVSPDMAVPGQAPRSLRITAFSVTSGEHPRATFSWTGSGTSPVAIQWRPTLDGGSSEALKAGAGMRSASPDESDGWTTIQEIAHGMAAESTPSRPAAQLRSAVSAASGDDATFTFTTTVDAPEGFYRIVIRDSEAE